MNPSFSILDYASYLCYSSFVIIFIYFFFVSRRGKTQNLKNGGRKKGLRRRKIGGRIKWAYKEALC